MQDYHNHLEKGSLDHSWLDQFLRQGEARGITDFGLAEHAYLFRELLPLYEGRLGDPNTALGRRQRDWFFAKAGKWALVDYFSLLQGRGVKIGLELDWFPGSEGLARELLAPWPWDYIIGSVHWLDGWAYDLWEDTWQGRDPDLVWARYIENAAAGANSGCFDILGHADAIKIFRRFPGVWPEEAFSKLAALLAVQGVAAEVNTAFRYRGYSEDFCPSPRVLEIFNQAGVGLTFGSDAHYPEQVGLYQTEARDYAGLSGYNSYQCFVRRRSIPVSLTNEHEEEK